MITLDPEDVGKLCYKTGGSALAYSGGSPNLIFRTWFNVPIAAVYQKYGMSSGYGLAFPDPATIAPDAVTDMKDYTWASAPSNPGAEEYTYNYTAAPGDVVGPKVWSVIARAALYRIDTADLPSSLRQNITNMVWTVDNAAARSFQIRGDPRSSITPPSSWTTCTAWGSGYSGAGAGDIYLGGSSPYFSLGASDYLFIFIYLNVYDHLGTATDGLWRESVILSGLSAKVE
jgi:hypothetical protein